MTLAYLYAWVMIGLRSLGVIMQLPVVAGRPLPVIVRIGLSIGLASLLAGLVRAAPLPPSIWALVSAVIFEVVLGLALGFVVQMAFASVDMAGRIIGTEVGIAPSPGMGVPEPSHEPIAALLSTLAIVLFFMSGAHQGVLQAFARSFQLAPAGGAAFDTSAPNALILDSTQSIELGLRISAPFIAMNFLVNLAFSVLGRAVPKMNVFALSFAARSLFGIALLSTSGALLARYVFVEFGHLPLRMLQLLRAG